MSKRLNYCYCLYLLERVIFDVPYFLRLPLEYCSFRSAYYIYISWGNDERDYLLIYTLTWWSKHSTRQTCGRISRWWILQFPKPLENGLACIYAYRGEFKWGPFMYANIMETGNDPLRAHPLLRCLLRRNSRDLANIYQDHNEINNEARAKLPIE